MAAIKMNLSDITFGTPMSDIKVPAFLKRNIISGVDYFDEVLGGNGLTPSQMMIFTGDPGAGKTTMLMKVADSLGKNDNNIVVYNSAEESVYQLRKVVDRIGIKGNFLVGNEKSIDKIVDNCKELQRLNPGKELILIVDSLQNMEAYHEGYKKDVDFANLVAERMIAFAKQSHAAVITIGQVTKSGALAGSNKVKHAVDTHIHLGVEEKDEQYIGTRVLEVRKNRFGGSGHILFLDLGSKGFNKIGSVGC